MRYGYITEIIEKPVDVGEGYILLTKEAHHQAFDTDELMDGVVPGRWETLSEAMPSRRAWGLEALLCDCPSIIAVRRKRATPPTFAEYLAIELKRIPRDKEMALAELEQANRALHHAPTPEAFRLCCAYIAAAAQRLAESNPSK